MAEANESGKLRTNPNAAHPASLQYRHQRRRYIRSHTKVHHEHGGPVIHIPVHVCRYLHTESGQLEAEN